jgi:hypothetical protein
MAKFENDVIRKRVAFLLSVLTILLFGAGINYRFGIFERLIVDTTKIPQEINELIDNKGTEDFLDEVIPQEKPSITATQIQQEILIIPAFEYEGIPYQVKNDGLYSFEIVEGAYSPYAFEIDGDNKWRTLTKIYINKNIRWDYDEYGFNIPSDEDYQIGFFESSSLSTKELAEDYGKGDSVLSFLKEGDIITFVTVDEKESYAFDGENRGNIVIGISALNLVGLETINPEVEKILYKECLTQGNKVRNDVKDNTTDCFYRCPIGQIKYQIQIDDNLLNAKLICPGEPIRLLKFEENPNKYPGELMTYDIEGFHSHLGCAIEFQIESDRGDKIGYTVWEEEVSK